MWRAPVIFVLLMVAFALVAPPQEARQRQGAQQQSSSAKPTPPPQLESIQHGQQPGVCPGSSKPNVSCGALSAESDYRQALAAEEQVSLNWFQSVVGLFTVVAAGFAALFAKQAAEAARDNLAHDKRSSRTELRPWLSSSGFDVHPFQEGEIDGVRVPYGLIARVNFLNIGKTPALRATVFTDHRVRPFDEQEAPVFTVVDGPFNPGVIGPNRDIYGVQVGIGPQETDMVMGRRARIWLYARAEYQEPAHGGPNYVTEVTIGIMYNGDEVTPEGRRHPLFIARTGGPLNTMT
jgi:hypothetical protein